ncbi:hypothetical protein QWY81_17740 [Polaribacter undariae]|uniref:Uncharacterized protein n=1 Tax=Polaribacter sejongensis TaxID=985043 RepID=A0AAJ1VIL0_9FLAO|nr:hypothetical protein [Polaribacter undariae]MDN3621314.1 hypothetical protein [Polaribacter undariae]UWD31856.1 hypothetical protein NQP51_17205 [Polaribacter undariae]
MGKEKHAVPTKENRDYLYSNSADHKSAAHAALARAKALEQARLNDNNSLLKKKKPKAINKIY